MTNKFPPLFITLLILIAGASSIYLINQHWSKQAIEMKNTLATKVGEQQEKDLKSIIFEAQKNVVQIEAGNETSQKIGSGFLYNNKGDIITNAHVVDGADYITVKLANAQTYTAALVGAGEEQDIALIRVPQLANQSPAQIANDNQVDIGTEIVAVGSPLGFQNSVTLGIISGLNRTFTIDNYNYDNVYQISANITHGNSGGPLIDRTTGKVIAINSAGTDEGGIGFSIPVKNVLDVFTKWSKEADNQQLNFNSSINQTVDPDQLKQDSDYIVNYFFESLSIRDYINAYALLGSEIQSNISYQDFRNDYIHVVNITKHDQTAKYLSDNNQVELSLSTTMSVRSSVDETKEEHWKYIFHVGYENDQLKVLKISKTEVS